MDSPQLIIGRLLPDQWPLYKAIRLEALKTEPQAFTSKYEDGLLIPDQTWEDRLATSLILFAITPVGVAGMMGAYEESDDLTCIVSAYVQPQLRGRGVGQRLLQELLKVLRPTGKQIVLDVYPDQLAAIRVYQKAGFQFIEIDASQACRRMALQSRTG